MQGLADSAGTCVQLSDHAFDLLAQTDGIQIHAKDIGAGIQGLQAAEVLLAFLDFQTCNGLLQLGQQRIGRGSECIACIIDTLQVNRPSCAMLHNLSIRVGDLSIAPCHRLFYPE